ncbi:hypothetical protein ABZP36_006609 [Zizania latifolia]
MRPIRLPEPPGGGMETPEIFMGGAASVVRRAVVIGNGSPGRSDSTGALHSPRTRAVRFQQDGRSDRDCAASLHRSQLLAS